MSCQVGESVGRYEVIRELGRGGMGAVFLVRQAGLGGLFALKVVEAPGAGLRARLLDEGRHQARVRHPNVVLMVELLELDGGLGLVMEYVNGPTLGDWLHGRALPLYHALALFDGVVQGVGAAHAEGLVHRDIKPSNVLMAQASPLPVPKVADFGLVKLLDNDAPGMTRSGVMMGTVGWMAPEQSEDASRVDQRADVFSLGCVLYRLVCGRGAFEGMSNLDFLNASHKGTWVRPRVIEPGLPDNVVAAIEGALQPNRELRIASCEELRAVLGGAVLEPVRRAPVVVGAQTWSDDSAAPPEPVPSPSSPTLAPEPPANSAPRPSPIAVPQVRVDAPAPAARRGVPLFAVMFLGAAAAMMLVVSLPMGGGQPAPGAMAPAPSLEAPPAYSPPARSPAPRDSRPPAPAASARPKAAPKASTIDVQADAGIRKICVQSEARCYDDGPLPPGTYPVWVTGADGAAWQAGAVTVGEGEHVTLRCSSATRACEQ